MPILDNPEDFVSGENITASKLNNLVDGAQFVSGSGQTTDDSTLEVHTSGYLKVKDGGINTTQLANDAVTNAKIANNAVTNAKIANDAVTYAKMQNVSATDRVLGRDSAGAGDVEEITPSALRTMINVEDGANNYSHPTGDGNLHVPATGTTNERKILTAGSTAGSFSWAHNNQNYETTTYTNTLQIVPGGKSGVGVFWPSVQSSSVTAMRSGRNAWIVGSYSLNTNYPNVTNNHAIFLINLPNAWKALSSGGGEFSTGWHRSYASTSSTTNSNAGGAGHFGHAGIQLIPGSTNYGIELSILDWSGFYLTQGSFYVSFLLDDTSMNS